MWTNVQRLPTCLFHCWQVASQPQKHKFVQIIHNFKSEMPLTYTAIRKLSLKCKDDYNKKVIDYPFYKTTIFTTKSHKKSINKALMKLSFWWNIFKPYTISTHLPMKDIVFLTPKIILNFLWVFKKVRFSDLNGKNVNYMKNGIVENFGKRKLETYPSPGSFTGSIIR